MRDCAFPSAQSHLRRVIPQGDAAFSKLFSLNGINRKILSSSCSGIAIAYRLPSAVAHLGQMPHIDTNITHVLRRSPSRWDRQIIADLLDEMQGHLADNLESVPAMRSFLAITGYRNLRNRIEKAIISKQGVDAVRSMAHAMRSFALGSPGLAAAAFRNPVLDGPEWAAAGQDLADEIFAVLNGVGISGIHAKHAVRILRSLVRGFVLNEMVSAAAHPIEFQRSYNLAVEMFIAGLPTLAMTPVEEEIMAERPSTPPSLTTIHPG